eukprot:4878939-Pleurochrysis_carterae.AAC.3
MRCHQVLQTVPRRVKGHDVKGWCDDRLRCAMGAQPVAQHPRLRHRGAAIRAAERNHHHRVVRERRSPSQTVAKGRAIHQNVVCPRRTNAAAKVDADPRPSVHSRLRVCDTRFYCVGSTSEGKNAHNAGFDSRQ